MAELLKNVYNKPFIKNLGQEFSKCYPRFNETDFANKVFAKGWLNLELKARMRRITESLHDTLPADYTNSLKILIQVADNLKKTAKPGFEYMLFPDFVELYGLDHFDLSVAALEQITKLASAEFAVRPFILAAPKKMMSQMVRWSKSKDIDVRRLASEGCRPRLPWAMALPIFKQDPTPIFKILHQLRFDESLYVRRSVANNLNDISKDHADQIVDIGQQWLGDNDETDWIIKHACRGLLKKAHPGALALFGFGDIQHLKVNGLSVDKSVVFGDYLPFSFELTTAANAIGTLRIEYGIDFMKANGKTARKIFKIGESDYLDKTKSITRRHAFKPFSTRKHYAGTHGFALLLNGVQVAHSEFELTGI